MNQKKAQWNRIEMDELKRCEYQNSIFLIKEPYVILSTVYSTLSSCVPFEMIEIDAIQSKMFGSKCSCPGCSTSTNNKNSAFSGVFCLSETT